MKPLFPLEAARKAVAANPDKPATAILHASDDVRLVVFRLAPGQQVVPHSSTSTVSLLVLAGAGQLTGADDAYPLARDVKAGDMVIYEPNELHGMRALDDELLLLATITPRPGVR